MTAAYQANVAPVARILKLNGRPMVQPKDAVLVLLGPIDYLFWTRDVEGKIDSIGGDVKQRVPDARGKEMWITGKIDEAALRHFEAKGWEVTENANEVLFKEQEARAGETCKW